MKTTIRVATEFIEQTLDSLELGTERFFPVPGNHDIDRMVAKRAWEKLRAGIGKADPQDVARWVANDGKALPGFERDWLDQVLERQAAYRRSVTSTLGLTHLDPASSEGTGTRFDLMT